MKYEVLSEGHPYNLKNWVQQILTSSSKLAFVLVRMTKVSKTF